MRAVVFAFVLALGACQTPCPAPDSEPRVMQLTCEDGSELRITLTRSPEIARVEQDGYTTLTLPARIAGTSTRYSEGGADLRVRVGAVLWTRPGADETTCSERL